MHLIQLRKLGQRLLTPGLRRGRLLISANATFALKAALWFRRVRFDMSAPDPRYPRRTQAENPLNALCRFGQPPLRTRRWFGVTHGLRTTPRHLRVLRASPYLYLR